jgi:TPR repeat protein
MPEVKWQVMQIKNEQDCSAGNGMACVNLGIEYLKKYPNSSSYSDRSEAESFQKGINAGEPTAYYALAGLYLLDQKGSEAIGLLEKGCKAGHALACKKGASLLFLGENGVTINVDRAGQLYGDACRLDPSDAESCANAPKKPEPKSAPEKPTNKKIAKKGKK